MGFGSIGGFNPNLNAYGAGNVKKPAEGEQQGETKAPELKMAETKGAETDLNVNNLSGLDALAAYGKANLGKSLQTTGEISSTDAPAVTQGEKGALNEYDPKDTKRHFSSKWQFYKAYITDRESFKQGVQVIIHHDDGTSDSAYVDGGWVNWD